MSVAVMPEHVTDLRRPAPAMGYIPGLDGIRAIAVLAVLLYHSGVLLVPGGFLGVDVFFVLSGFLISSLLLQEIERTQSVSFKQFYIRRARRLLPALFATLALSAILVLIFARDAAFQFRQDAIASLFYVSNWWYIVQDLSYFEAMGRPPVLQHLWSLAVEEQFYLLWPLALVFLYKWRGRPGVGRVALIVSLVSTLIMAIVSFVWNVPGQGGDASRLYFGTDTHCMGLLLGAALATVWRPGALPKRIKLPAQIILWAVALASLAGLFTIFHKAGEDSAWLYRGGFFVVSALTAVIIALASHPAIGFGRLLAIQPMKYIGERSYGLYLYHWPIFVITRPGIDLPFDGVPAWILRMGLTFGVAELSYRYLEIPIRHGALSKTWNRWRERGASVAGARVAGIVAGVAAFVFATGTALASIPAPSADDYLNGMTSTGQDLQQEAKNKPKQADKPPVQVPEGADLTKQPITAVGDSVMLGATGALEKAFDVTVDAAVSRQSNEIEQRIDARQAAGQLDDVVVIHAGTNGTAYWDDLKASLEDLQDREVVLVTVRTPNVWMDDSNRNIRGMANQFDNVRIADWELASRGHREYFVVDGTHLTTEGIQAYVDTIRTALKGDGTALPAEQAPTP